MEGYRLRCIDRDGTRHDVMWVEGVAVVGERVLKAKHGEAALAEYMLTKEVGGVWEAVEVDRRA